MLDLGGLHLAHTFCGASHITICHVVLLEFTFADRLSPDCIDAELIASTFSMSNCLVVDIIVIRFSTVSL